MVNVLSVILLILMMLIGKDHGLQAFLTILMNIAILAAAVFTIIWGGSPLLVGGAAGLLLTCLILFYQNGNNTKTRTAFAVITIVLLVMLFIGTYFSCAGLSAGYSEVKISLDDGLFLDGNVSLSMVQIEIVIILLGLLGAVKDTAVAVTSAVYEVHRNNPSLMPSQLLVSGMNIGREILATTMNTLFFTCIGESLLLFNIVCYWGYSFSFFINSKALYQVLLFSGIAGLGCIAAIPLSAFAMTFVLKHRHDTKESMMDETNHD